MIPAYIMSYSCVLAYAFFSIFSIKLDACILLEVSILHAYTN